MALPPRDNVPRDQRKWPGIAKLYETGWPLRKISEMTGTPISTIHGRLRHDGVLMRHGPPTGLGVHSDHQALENLRRLYEHGYTITQLATALGISHSTVNYRLRASGTRIRPRRGNGQYQTRDAKGRFGHALPATDTPRVA